MTAAFGRRHPIFKQRTYSHYHDEASTLAGPSLRCLRRGGNPKPFSCIRIATFYKSTTSSTSHQLWSTTGWLSGCLLSFTLNPAVHGGAIGYMLTFLHRCTHQSKPVFVVGGGFLPRLDYAGFWRWKINKKEMARNSAHIGAMLSPMAKLARRNYADAFWWVMNVED